MSFFGVTQELLDDLRRKAIKVKIVQDNRSSVMMEFSEPEMDLILTLKPAMIFAIIDTIERLDAKLAERTVVWASLESKIACLEAELAGRPIG